MIHQNKPLWYPGPSCRECCIEDESELALSAWWWEVRNRFEDLGKIGLEDREITQALIEQIEYIEELLEERVPKPSEAAWARYEEYRLEVGTNRRRQRPYIAPQLALLGLTWPCTLEDAKQRWRALALTHHPDRGGDPKEFMRLKAAYDKLAASMGL